MKLLSDISRVSGAIAWSYFRTSLAIVLKAHAIVAGPLVVISLLLSLLVGSEAWAPLWFYFQQTAPLYAQIAFWVLLPSALLAMVAALGFWLAAWYRHIPELSAHHIGRTRRYSRRVAVAWITSRLCPFRIRLDYNGYFRTTSPLVPTALITSLGLSASVQLLE